MVLPLKGWSIYGAPGGPLHDAAADAAFVQSLTRTLRKDIAFHKLPLHINDPAFAQHCCQLLMQFMAKQAGSRPSEQLPHVGPNHPSERGSPGTPIKAARKLGRAAPSR
jgi:hypothetical protein